VVAEAGLAAVVAAVAATVVAAAEADREAVVAEAVVAEAGTVTAAIVVAVAAETAAGNSAEQFSNLNLDPGSPPLWAPFFSCLLLSAIHRESVICPKRYVTNSPTHWYDWIIDIQVLCVQSVDSSTSLFPKLPRSLDHKTPLAYTSNANTTIARIGEWLPSLSRVHRRNMAFIGASEHCPGKSPTSQRAELPCSIRLSEIISALSYALDLTEGQPVGHSVRACIIEMRLAQQVGISVEEQADLYYGIPNRLQHRDRGVRHGGVPGFIF
jgi:hypothetical protein